MLDQISLKGALKFVVDNRGKTAPTAESGHKLIATNCVSNRDLYPIYENLRYVSQETYDTWFRAHPLPFDILLTNKGSQNGAVCLVPDPVDFCIAQDMMALRADETKIDPLYLFAALRSASIQSAIKNLNVDGVIPHFKKTDFDKLFIPRPDSATQQAVGLLHFQLCSKIELNKRMNETLEEMARALFRDWFVDFGPTRRQMDGATDPAAIMGHAFPPEKATTLAPLFPTKLGDDGLPVGWDKQPVGELAEIVGGGTPNTKTEEFWEGGTHLWATPRDLSKLSGVFIGDTERKLTNAGLAKVSSGLSQKGSVLMSSRAPIGYLAIASQPVAVNQGFIVMRPTDRFPSHFAKLWCEANMDTIEANANGSTFQEISKKNFKPILATVPTKDVMAAFSDFAGLLFDKVQANEQEKQALAEMRDLLLPKLMSGEIRLAEKVGFV